MDHTLLQQVFHPEHHPVMMHLEFADASAGAAVTAATTCNDLLKNIYVISRCVHAVQDLLSRVE